MRGEISIFCTEGIIEISFPIIPPNGFQAPSTIFIERLLADHLFILLSNAGETVIVYFCKNASLFFTPVEETVFVARTFVFVGDDVVGLVVIVVFTFVGVLLVVVVFGFVVVVLLVDGAVFIGVTEEALFVVVATFLEAVADVFFVVVATGGVGKRGTITLFVGFAVATAVFVVSVVVHLFMRASVAAMSPFVSTNAIGSNVLLNR